MPRTQDRLVAKWIAVFGSLAILLVVFGGYVRLTRSGLSIVEWRPVDGAVPPLSQQAWEVEFSKYRASPEYQQINRGIAIEEYKRIFLIEWFHRLLARIAGLVFAVPFLILLFTRRIPWRQAGLYAAIGLLFLSQAVIGWVMVASGLDERPSVSHFLLAAHLFLALSLICLSTWTVLGHVYGFPPAASRAAWSRSSVAAVLGIAVLLIQIAYGAFTAGLKAGYVSNTWPLMLGRWIPAGLLRQIDPPLLNLVGAPLTVAFVHRWLAFLALLVAVLIARLIVRSRPSSDLRRLLALVVALGVLQVGIGIAVVVSGVGISLALLHQFNAICLIVISVIVLHRLRDRDHATSDRLT